MDTWGTVRGIQFLDRVPGTLKKIQDELHEQNELQKELITTLKELKDVIKDQAMEITTLREELKWLKS